MLLRDFLHINELTYERFGLKIGFSGRSVEKWARGERYPTFGATKSIRLATDHQVTSEDHYVAVLKYHYNRPLPAKR